ncbi:uncharacterized protein LOC113306349 [Papaver somniferum]|uniref:uncharacterized protein LOC113306349 n=1 Tax=Papaver somniferum TaxID=3469 RepID=UPI000E6F4F85|nr:uncharacterized protein LOC113306349 [Papaver somniferum]
MSNGTVNIPQCCAAQDREDREVNILKHELDFLRYLCKNDEESLHYILWDCPAAQQCWQWLAGFFHTRAVDDFKTCYKALSGRSSMDKNLWLLAIMVTKSELWKARNAICFEGGQINFLNLKTNILLQTSGYSRRIKSFMFNNQDDLFLVRVFNVQHKKVRSIIMVACERRPPDEYSLILCCDGAARRNPGPVGAGCVLRDHNCGCMGALVVGLGLATKYDAEIEVVIEGLE